ncbi:MAG: hypothetical protein PHY02_02480 [Phycisphaerae bacterium]|nr:hypothetical protein [Phycisphaerae bacterium]
MKPQGEIILPSDGETAAITLKPKTAALCFDRIWATSDDVAPRSIRCWGGTQEELNGLGLAADWNIKTKRSPVLAMVGPDDKKLEMLRAQSDLGLASAFRRISTSFAVEHKTPLIPVFDFIKQRNKMYKEGNRDVIVAVLNDLEIADEKQLTWKQVIEFRKDRDNQKKYKRLLHWLDREMVEKSQKFIEDEIAIKLDDYESALRKYGIRTIAGTIEESLDMKMFLPAFMTGSALKSAGHPKLGFLVGGCMVIGKIVIKLTRVMLNYDDIERGSNSEISWVYEAKRQLN